MYLLLLPPYIAIIACLCFLSAGSIVIILFLYIYLYMQINFPLDLIIYWHNLSIWEGIHCQWGWDNTIQRCKQCKLMAIFKYIWILGEREGEREIPRYGKQIMEIIVKFHILNEEWDSGLIANFGNFVLKSKKCCLHYF